MNIDDIILKIKYKYTENAWYSFFSVILGGLLVHSFIFTNELFNHDDMNATFQPKGIGVGMRWFQSIAHYLVTSWGAPSITVPLTIVLIAIAALLSVDLFKIQSKVFAIVLGVTMIATPTVACFMSYVEGCYLFAIGIPCSVLAVRWFEKGFHGFFASVIILAFAISGYQSNIAITIALLYVVFFLRLFDEDVSMKQWFLSFGKATLLLLVGLITFFLSIYIVSFFTTGQVESGYSTGISTEQLTVTGYEAQSEAATLYFGYIGQSIVISVKYFIKYYFNIFFGGSNVSVMSYISSWYNICLLFIAVIIVISNTIKLHNIWRKMLTLFVFALAPLFMNFTEVLLNGKAHESLQMMYSLVVTAFLIVGLYERDKVLRAEPRDFLSIIIFIGMCINIYYHAQVTSDAYMRMNSIYEAAYSEMTRIIDRVEQLPEWEKGNRTVYFDYSDGYLINKDYQYFTFMDNQIDYGWLGLMGTQVYNFWDNENTTDYVHCYFGWNVESPTEEEIESIKSSQLYKELKAFPSKDSIKVIENVVVIRMD